MLKEKLEPDSLLKFEAREDADRALENMEFDDENEFMDFT